MDIGAIWNMIIINPMVNTLLFIYSLLGNFGIAIIIFTLLIRLITHPLTVQQMKGTAEDAGNAELERMAGDPEEIQG